MIGIDIGGTNIKAASVSVDGKIGRRIDLPTPAGREALIGAVQGVLAQFSDSRECAIASPGLASPDHRGIVWMQGRMDALEGLDWSDALGRAAWVLNDAQAATLGEAWLGAGRGVDNLLLLTLGTGVGGGIILNGQLAIGAEGKAGHLGHICLDPDGPPDIANTPGSLEDLIGEHTLARRSGGRFHSTADLVQAVQAGDAAAAAVWERMIHVLACGLASLINCFDPEVVVLGGGIAHANEALFAPLRARLEQLEWRPTGRGAKVVPAELGDLAGAIGAARFAMLKNATNLD